MIRLVMLATGMIFMIIAITSTPVNAGSSIGDTCAWIGHADGPLIQGADPDHLPPLGNSPGTGISLWYSPGSLFTSTDALHTPPCLSATHPSGIMP